MYGEVRAAAARKVKQALAMIEGLQLPSAIRRPSEFAKLLQTRANRFGST